MFGLTAAPEMASAVPRLMPFSEGFVPWLPYDCDGR